MLMKMERLSKNTKLKLNVASRQTPACATEDVVGGGEVRS